MAIVNTMYAKEPVALYKPTDVERYLSTVYELYKLVDLRSRGPRGTRDLTPKDRDGPIGCPPPARRFREAYVLFFPVRIALHIE